MLKHEEINNDGIENEAFSFLLLCKDGNIETFLKKYSVLLQSSETLGRKIMAEANLNPLDFNKFMSLAGSYSRQIDFLMEAMKNQYNVADFVKKEDLSNMETLKMVSKFGYFNAELSDVFIQKNKKEILQFIPEGFYLYEYDFSSLETVMVFLKELDLKNMSNDVSLPIIRYIKRKNQIFEMLHKKIIKDRNPKLYIEMNTDLEIMFDALKEFNPSFSSVEKLKDKGFLNPTVTMFLPIKKKIYDAFATVMSKSGENLVSIWMMEDARSNRAETEPFAFEQVNPYYVKSYNDYISKHPVVLYALAKNKGLSSLQRFKTKKDAMIYLNGLSGFDKFIEDFANINDFRTYRMRLIKKLQSF